MKWKTNGIAFRRGCYEVLIARYDSKGPWYEIRGFTTQQSAKALFRQLGKYLKAETCEVKKLYDEYDRQTTKTTVFTPIDGGFRFFKTAYVLEDIYLTDEGKRVSHGFYAGQNYKYADIFNVSPSMSSACIFESCDKAIAILNKLNKVGYGFEIREVGIPYSL